MAPGNKRTNGVGIEGKMANGGIEPKPLASTPPSAETSSQSVAVGVNRKKQKRREKQAARLAAEQHGPNSSMPLPPPPSSHPLPTSSSQDGYASSNGHLPPGVAGHALSPAPLAQAHRQDNGYVDQEFDADGNPYYSEEEGQIYSGHYQVGSPPNGHPTTGAGKKSKRRKKGKSAVPQDPVAPYPVASSSRMPGPPPPPPPQPLSNIPRPGHSISRDRIWNTSTQEERERIKEFWLSLGEEDRRSLVKVEKEAVLRKMKEQQKHSCSCTVCGRKRTAIEEELEVLYDAYYEELEQYANHQQTRVDDGIPMMPPPRRHGPMSRPSHPHPDRMAPLAHHGPPRHFSSKGRVEELPDGDEEDEEEDGDDDDYSDEEDDEEDEGDYSDEEPEEEEARGPAADFFNFGNSLTVQGANHMIEPC